MLGAALMKQYSYSGLIYYFLGKLNICLENGRILFSLGLNNHGNVFSWACSFHRSSNISYSKFVHVYLQSKAVFVVCHFTLGVKSNEEC